MSDPAASSASLPPQGRPQFGEYATPEEQARRAGRTPDAAVGEHVVNTVSPAMPPAPVAPVPAPTIPDSTASAAATAGERRPPHPANRIITLALLGYGLFNVILSVISYSDTTSVMNEALSILGAQGEFTNHAQGRLWGTIASIVLITGWTLTAAWSVLRLRAGRVSWWVPLVGGVVFTIAASVCLTVPMFGDPAFLAVLTPGAAS